MRQTIAEKILSGHADKRARAGDIVIADVDYCFGQDGTSGLIVDSFKKLNKEKVFDRNRFSMVIDHSAPSPNIGISAIHKKMREFSREFGVKLFDIGDGVCHQVIPETGYITSGDLVLGADSHTCTYGAINALSTGVGSTDLAITLASGKSWFRVPETIKIVVDGELSKGVYAKDVILYLVGQVGADGATYKSIEFCGEIIDALSVEGRFTIANMAVEMGAKCGLMRSDKKTREWVKKHSTRESNPVDPDEDAVYSKVLKYDLSELEPQVACPHTVDNVKPLGDVEGIEIDEVYIGTCTNGRLEDMEIAAKILKGKRAAKGVKLIITPASKKIYIDSLKKGYINIFMDAGAVVNNPGCGPCVGTHQGVLADGEKAFSTANRNFKGRMGNPNAEIFLGSPAVAAATAIAGVISDPREYKRRL